MAIISVHKPVRRRVVTGTGKRLVATFAPEGLYVREHGRRTSYLVPWGAAFVYGARLEADRRRAARAANRKARKGSRKARV